MPAWATIVLTLGSTLIGAGSALAATWIQLRNARREREEADRAGWRHKGALVAGPVRGVLEDLDPAALAAAGGRSGQTMDNIGRRWWRARDELLVFAAAHPSADVAAAAERVTHAVSETWESVVRLNRALEARSQADVAAAQDTHRRALEQASALGDLLRR